MRALAIACLGATLAAPAIAYPKEHPSFASPHHGGGSRVSSLRGEMSAATGLGLWPKTSWGGDLAFSFGRPRLHARTGLLVLWLPVVPIGRGEVGMTIESVHLDGCAAINPSRHRLRACVGMHGGVAHVRWRGFSRSIGESMPWVAAAAGVDWGVAIADRVALFAGASALAPIVAPEARASGDRVRPSAVGGLAQVGISIDLR
jgi:hypothetical protein